MSKSHDAHVDSQFGAHAGAYLTSAVHATGADLDSLGLLLAGHGGAHALDLGCGAGHAGFAAAPHVASVTACDLSPRMLEVVEAEARRRGLANLRTRQGSAMELPFADASFGVVLSRYSAHHWPDLARGLAEAARVLAPGGICVFMDTVAPGDAKLDTVLQAVEVLRDPSHVRDYTEREWVAAAGAAGLAVRERSLNRVRLDYPGWIARLATPPVLSAAIEALWAVQPETVRAAFALEADHSFTVDKLNLVLERPGPAA